MKIKSHLIGPEMVYPKALSTALKGMGDYVYAYYRLADGFLQPFYVGKGKGTRVLAHWKNAITSPKNEQEKIIGAMLKQGELPVVKLLAYKLEKTPKSEVYSVAERVLQDAFGIQSVWKKRPGAKDRLDDIHVSSLVQKREDSKAAPVLTLDAVVGSAGNRKTMSQEQLAEMLGAPVLLVGISNTYQPSYSQDQLAEMARMYWVLKRKFGNTTYPTLKNHDSPVLLAWSSKLKGYPTIVGAWRIQKGSFMTPKGLEREICKVTIKPDLELRRNCIGIRLAGTGNNYQGPRIVIPVIEMH